jgi:hypothetical protein
VTHAASCQASGDATRVAVVVVVVVAAGVAVGAVAVAFVAPAASAAAHLAEPFRRLEMEKPQPPVLVLVVQLMTARQVHQREPEGMLRNRVVAVDQAVDMRRSTQ